MDEEQRADEEERTGRYKVFNSVEELIADLHEGPSVPLCPWCGLIFYPVSSSDICRCILQ